MFKLIMTCLTGTKKQEWRIQERIELSNSMQDNEVYGQSSMTSYDV